MAVRFHFFYVLSSSPSFRFKRYSSQSGKNTNPMHAIMNGDKVFGSFNVCLFAIRLIQFSTIPHTSGSKLNPVAIDTTGWKENNNWPPCPVELCYLWGWPHLDCRNNSSWSVGWFPFQEDPLFFIWAQKTFFMPPLVLLVAVWQTLSGLLGLSTTTNGLCFFCKSRSSLFYY